METAEIEQWWGKLEPGIREWLMDNPGTVILPRTVANAINTSVGETTDQDRYEVSEAARSFIRAKAEERRNRPIE
ncbi:hypothetical protein D477_016575 [Arthrobacter crystallopoietes BAB-32]|uniref:Uncharacterized protein n=1 Tax=Arthrobacter crystallopoietes BAB-32 TaxID=1246476 RepID=N1UVN3_9MICC|nr:hypothetical protein [Arthrobacter crystallopoietes]EMY33125.1 hypothetical protein D477_016575 [Arthrobacter crystallopoietes BAB-32]